MEKRYEKKTYVICHNNSDVVHPVEVKPGTTLTSGQPIIEEFADKEAWETRLKELRFDTSKLNPLFLNRLISVEPSSDNNPVSNGLVEENLNVTTSDLLPYDSQKVAESLEESEESEEVRRIRARDEEGKYVRDDPSTLDVNEAWVTVP